MVEERTRRLQEYDHSITRLAFPADHRDALDLQDGQPIAFDVRCREGHPVVVIEPLDIVDGESPATRTVQIGEQGQATVTVPRSLAAALGLRDTDLRLTVEAGTLVVQPASRSSDSCSD
jgi:bifunctional DNA-binding transcriptional regulator/antitoxin component of YhaV-PrlF toxin-antitoxin module